MRYNEYRDRMLLHQMNGLLEKKREPNHWSNRYFRFIYNGKDREYPITNHWLYEKSRDIGMNDVSVYEHFDQNKNPVNADKSMIYIHTSIHTTYLCNITYTIYFSDMEKRVSFFPRTNREITKESIVDLVFKHIEENHLYPEGRYGGMQRFYWVSKEGLISILKKETSSSDHTRIWIEGRFNIFTLDEGITNRQLYQVCMKHGRKDTPTEVCRMPSVHSLIPYDFDGDVDELENEFYNALDDLDKSKIYI